MFYGDRWTIREGLSRRERFERCKEYIALSKGILESIYNFEARKINRDGIYTKLIFKNNKSGYHILQSRAKTVAERGLISFEKEKIRLYMLITGGRTISPESVNGHLKRFDEIVNWTITYENLPK